MPVQPLVTPLFRTPFTDIFGPLGTFQTTHSICRFFELKLVDCLETHGMIKGTESCADLIADFKECQYQSKQCAREDIMIRERDRQWKAGERTQHYEKSPPDTSY